MTEFGAVLVIGGPLLITLLFAGMEVARIFAVKSALDTSARNGARLVIVAYNNGDTNVVSGGTVSDTTAASYCDNHIQIPHYIQTGNGQWTAHWDNTTNPTQLTVTCTYPMAGAGSLPSIADPIFHLGSTANIQSQFTLPVQ